MAKREKNNKKLAFGLISLVAAIGVIVGVGYAYFSDVINGTGSATAGTLDISGTPTINQNGTAVSGGTITNLNPGDVITLNTGTITNNGSKSAWIRSVLQFTSISNTPNTGTGGATANVGDLASYLWVCTGTATQSQLITASTTSGGFSTNIPAGTTCEQPTTTGIYGAKTTYVAPGDVISGTGTGAETDGAASTWTPAAGSVPFIYFDAAAPNAAQNGNMAFNILIQALQYRNNTTPPTEAQWSTVVTTPFGL